MAWTTPKTFTNGEVLTHTTMNEQVSGNMNILKTSIEDDGTLAGVLTSRLTSDQTWTTDTTLADVTGLSFAIGASEIWTFEFRLFYEGPAAADIKFALTVPSGAAGIYGHNGGQSGTPDVRIAAIGTDIAANTVGVAAAEGYAGVVHGTVVNSTNAGTVQLQSAQFASSGTNTIFAGSSLVAHKIG